MGHVVEEGLLLGDRLVNEFQSPLGQEIWAIPVFAQDWIVQIVTFSVENEAEVAALFLVGKVQLSIGRGKAAHESAFMGRRSVRLTKMPFAGHERKVAGVVEDLGHRNAIVAELALGALRIR